MRRRVQAFAPRRWFHATSLEAAEKILAVGHLTPPAVLAEHYKGDKAFAPVEGLVYLTHDVKLGLTYARIRSYKGRGKYGTGALIEVEPVGRCQADEDEIGAAVDFVLHEEQGAIFDGEMAGHELESSVGHTVLEYVPAELSAKWRRTPERGIGGWSAKQKAKVGKAALGVLPREIIETITSRTRSIACEGARVLRAWRVDPGQWDADQGLIKHERSLPKTSYEQAVARAHERHVDEHLPLLPLPTRSQNPISAEWQRHYSKKVIALVHSAEKLLGVSVVGGAYRAGYGGSKGAVYPLSDGRVLKVTSDEREIDLVEAAVRDGRFDGFVRVYAGPVKMKSRGYVAYVREDVDPSDPLFDRPDLKRCVAMLSTESDDEYREGYRQMRDESDESAGLSDFLRRLDEEQGISVGDTRSNIGTRRETGELVLFDGQAYPMEASRQESPLSPPALRRLTCYRKPNPAEPWLFRKRFVYALTRRPASPWTVPEGFVELGPATAEHPFGTVVFERPLPRAAIEAFELEPLDPEDPIVLRRARSIYRDEVYERFSETSGFDQADAEGRHTTLSYSTRDGVEYQVTYWQPDWTPTGHLDVNDFDEAVAALWSSMPKAERDRRAESAVWRARR